MGLAVVSGGGTGIGAATAQMLVDEGHDVVIIGRRPEVLAAAAARIGVRAGRPEAVRPVVADLSRPDQVARAEPCWAAERQGGRASAPAPDRAGYPLTE